MPKLCGRNEKCFIEGSRVWGHHGGVLCLHLTERADHSSGCALDDSINNVLYTEDIEYQILTKQTT